MAVVADLQAKFSSDVSGFVAGVQNMLGSLSQLMEHSSDTQEALGGMGEAGEDAESSMGGFGSTMLGVAGNVLAVGTAITAGVVAVGLLGEKYNDAMLQVQNAGQLTDQQSQQVQDSLIKISDQGGATFTQMTSDIAPYMGVIKQLPGSMQNVGAATTQVSTASKDLSETMGVSLSSAFQVTTGMLQAYHLPASNAVAVSNQLAAVSSATGVPVSQLGSTFDQIKS
ncbi:MAG TPA: hypothetical protein VKU87_00075, partial [Thermomicrobiaceae bacterium]|nr:hypothetical protein [Thermomicrobiaceae bacterium]